jgi:hypothetical protein
MTLYRKLIPAIIAAAWLSNLQADVNLKLSERGVDINFSSTGVLSFEAPQLAVEGGNREKPVTEIKGGDTVSAQYPSGGNVLMKIQGTSSIVVSYSNLPTGAKSLIFLTRIPYRMAMGGQFSIANKPTMPFPETKGKQIVCDGASGNATIIDPSGAGVRLIAPPNFQQIQDNRVFNTNVFLYLYYYKFKEARSNGEITINVESVSGQPAATTASAAPVEVAAQIDRFGQKKSKEYPGKVKTEEELKADGERESKEFADYKFDSKFDSYGGLAGTGATYSLKKTGYFHVEESNKRWVLVTPEGNLFFQLGVCGLGGRCDDFTKVAGREKIYEWLPDKKDATFISAWRDSRPDWGNFSFYSANWIKKFGKEFSSEEWTGQAIKRLRSWGFNSAGAFSTQTESMRAANFPYVNFLPLGRESDLAVLPERLGASYLMDPFDSRAEAILEARFAKIVAPKANDPLLIGYFYGNEQHLEELPKKLGTYKSSKVAAKAALVKSLENKYKSIDKFNEAWKPASPFANFEALNEEPLFVRSTEGSADMEEFYRLYIETYYSMIEKLYRKYDPNHMLIGSRMTSGTSSNETAVKTAGKHTDVVSVNYYTYGIDGSFLGRVSEWSGGKPIILSEWYYGAPDTGLIGVRVRSQDERAKAYRQYVEQSAALPFIVGFQWFSYLDQSITGRFFEGFNGEGNNIGIVDVTDRPYKDLLSAAKESNSRVYDIMFGKEKAFVFDDPRFNVASKGVAAREVTIPRALPSMKMDGSTTNWPGRPAEPIDANRLVMGNPNEKLRGDFRLCWDDKKLYFLIHVKDPTPGCNSKSADGLWSGDGVELFIGKDTTSSGSMRFDDTQILLGAGKEARLHVVDRPQDAAQCTPILIRDASGDGYTLAVSIPWTVLGLEPKSNTEFLFDVAIDNSDDDNGRQHQLIWNGASGNSKRRELWGRARLIEN